MIVPGKSEPDLAKFSQAIGDLAQGGSNALGRAVVTLAPGTVETVVTDSRCTEGALVAPIPTSATAAATTIWLKATARGSFTWGHDASSAADRTFRYEIRRP
jgi:hypothetical protein